MMNAQRRCAALLLASFLAALSASAKAVDLPVRQSPPPATTDGVPHIQLGVAPVAELTEELLKRVEELDGVEIRPTVVSLPGALGFWIAEDVALARPDAIVGGREFAHMHPDGSLHASLSPELAARAARNGWAVPHPWADKRRGWEGFVMIYTPLSVAEMNVVSELIAASHEFITSGAPGSGEDEAPASPIQRDIRKQDPSRTCSTC